jgi:uncharacterized protein (DUF2062 family)
MPAMPRRLVKDLTRRLAPVVDAVTSRPWVRRYVPALADPDLWHLNRRSTARGVAVGLFAGLVPGPFQVLAAIALAIVFRANFPLAAITTLYTNPLTIVPLYLLAWKIGGLFLPGTAAGADLSPPPIAWSRDSLGDVFEWAVALGKPLALGLPLLALALAATGWIVVRLAWRWHAVHAWRRRQRLRRSAA